ncbi:unnamed protein product, partial [Porites evermanni]
MHNNSHSNLLCGIIYRHPNGDLERFIEYVSSTADRINRENKTCIIMGDFNIDLLKFKSHSATDESEIPSVSNSPMEYLNNPVCNSLYIFPVTCSEIETEISRLKTGKSVGPFSIPIDILKMLK